MLEVVRADAALPNRRDVDHIGEAVERPHELSPKALGAHGCHDAHDCEHHDESRKQAQGSPPVEALEGDLSVAIPLGEEQRRDQEAGEHEEEIHAEHSAMHHVVDVDGQHEQDRDPSDRIQRRDVAEFHPVIIGDRDVAHITRASDDEHEDADFRRRVDLVRT